MIPEPAPSRRYWLLTSMELRSHHILKELLPSLELMAVPSECAPHPQFEWGGLEPASKGYCTRTGCMIHRVKGN
jgi:hypothetical protein